MWTGRQTWTDKQLICSGVFVSVRVLCTNGGSVLWSCGGVDFLWLRSICALSGVIHTCARTSLVWSSTKEQNTRPTLITHFLHLNKACLTPSISSVQTPSGIHSSLHSCLPLLPPPLYLPLPVIPLLSPLSGFTFIYSVLLGKWHPANIIFKKHHHASLWGYTV